MSTTKAATALKAQYDTQHAITVSRHERMLLLVYRSLTDDGRAAVDRALSYEWTRQDSRTLSPKEIQAATARFGASVEILGKKTADPVDLQLMAYFANCGRKGQAAQGSAR